MTAQSHIHLVMCRPDFFEISYTINPWMDPGAWSTDRDRLRAECESQWQELHRTLTDLGATITLHEPRPGVPDMVFTANAAIVLDGKALLARFLDAERQQEEAHFKAFFEELRDQGLLTEVCALPDGVIQEGAGDCNWDVARQLFWGGYGQRSSRESCQHVAEFFGRKVVEMELVDPRYYHIDTCLAPLPSGHILYYPPAFSNDSIERLKRHAGGDEWLIAAGEEDASQLAVNLVAIGDRAVMSTCSYDLQKALKAAGFRVARAPLPAFGMSGGAAFCLTLRINHRSGEARISAAA